MIVTRSLKIPVHYAATKTKLDKLDNLTARVTFCIACISSLISDDTDLDRKTVRKLTKDNDIASRTGLSSGFVDQCVDKVIWSWKSYRKLHADWERRLEGAKERIDLAEDDRTREHAEKSLARLIKREPSASKFYEKNSLQD